MEPTVIVALVAGTAAVVGSLFTLKASREAERTKVKAQENTARLEGLKIQVDAWGQLVEDYRVEIDRLNGQLAAERASTAAQIAELRAVADNCYRNHAQRKAKP